NLGPKTWPQCFQACNGYLQSPINIAYSEIQYIKGLTIDLFGFEETITQTLLLLNNGHTAQVNIGGHTTPSIYSPLTKGRYRLVQFHYHWGPDNSVGSETFLNNLQYPLEEHIVFANMRYKDFFEAANSSDGLAVLSNLYKVGKYNSGLNPVISNLKYVRYQGQSHSFSGLKIRSIVDEDDARFFAFNGSLTTPPCSENVAWHVMAEPLELSQAQLEEFRKLYSTNNTVGTQNLVLIEKNFRPIQMLNGRSILASFEFNQPTAGTVGAALGLHSRWAVLALLSAVFIPTMFTLFI
ncbi:uncharacterized protein TRIADDRAFT_18497, partial [Trichoplax adhaerens]